MHLSATFHSDLFKGHGPASPGELMDWATVEVGEEGGGVQLAQVGDKVQRWGVQKCEDTMSFQSPALSQKHVRNVCPTAH